jgi:hypothetical protein
MRLRDLDLIKIIKQIDKDITDRSVMADLEEVYEVWCWHPGMG